MVWVGVETLAFGLSFDVEVASEREFFVELMILGEELVIVLVLFDLGEMELAFFFVESDLFFDFDEFFFDFLFDGFEVLNFLFVLAFEFFVFLLDGLFLNGKNKYLNE